jgi:hypothetical protein
MIGAKKRGIGDYEMFTNGGVKRRPLQLELKR